MGLSCIRLSVRDVMQSRRCIRLLWKCCQRCADRKSTRLNSSHITISYAVFCLKKKKSPGSVSIDLSNQPPIYISPADVSARPSALSIPDPVICPSHINVPFADLYFATITSHDD